MKNEYITETVPLHEIANKKITLNGSKVTLDIPAFQRGLVWNPAQVEALWDSIMRGIPIGCITLIKYASDSKEEYGIFDGQQRQNALMLGFYNPFGKGKEENKNQEEDKNQKDEKNPSSCLWIDLMPDKSQSRTRKYFLYLTTEGQPWGYRISDSGGEAKDERLTAGERREAVAKAGLQSVNLSFAKPCLEDMWPYKAKCPVPLAVLWELNKDIDEENFKSALLDSIEKYANHSWYKQIKDELNKVDENHIPEIYKGWKRANDAKAIVVVSPQEFNKEGEHGKNDDESEVAVFFSRLNRGGTVPSVEDVNYSILKSIVPSLKKLDDYAKDLTQPSRLASIAMRLYMTEKEGKWKGNINRKDVFTLVNDTAFKKFVYPGEDEESELKKRLDNLCMKLTYRDIDNQTGMPPYVLSTFISKFPDMFLLFLTMKEKACSPEGCSAFMLIGTYGQGISYKDAYESSKGGIRRLIHDLAVKGQLLVPPPVEVYAHMEAVVHDTGKSASERLQLLDQAWNPEMYKSAVDHVWWWHESSTRMLLLYACRRYLCSKFQNYNPAAAVWKEDNCPWDYDHIFPHSWVIQGCGNTQGKCHSYVSELINSLGNIAPVPFSFNRSKNDGAPYDSMNRYTNEVEGDSLLFADVDRNDAMECAFMRTSPARGSEIEKDENATLALACIVIRRVRRIYEECYNSLGWGSLLASASDLDKRRNFFSSLMVDDAAPWKGAKARIWSIAYNGKQKEIDPKFGYLQGWLACGEEVEFQEKDGKRQRGLACVCCGYGKIEWGIRRHPDDVSVDGNPNVWWIPNYSHLAEWGGYLYKQKRGEDYNSEDVKELVDSLKKLISGEQS